MRFQWTNAFSAAVRATPVAMVLASSVAGCGGGTGDVSGTITGLTASGLVLSNGSESISVAAQSTSFAFPTSLASGDTYAVTVTSQPTGLACSVAGGSGTVSDTSSTISVTVACVPVFGLSGRVDGLRTSGLVLSNATNLGTEKLTVSSGAVTFAFVGRLQQGAAYVVTVATQPSGQTCNVTNGSGTVASEAVGNIALTCP